METQEEIKTPIRLAGELDYKDGEVVAKNVLSNENGSVTLLAFDDNAMIARHQVSADVLVSVIEGSVEFEIDSQRHKLDTGDSIIMAANTPHTVIALSKAKVVLTRIKA